MLALAARVPIFVFFASAKGRGRYHFSACPPIYVKAASRDGRSEAIQRSVQAYADLIEGHLKRSPFEWYHFQPFLGAAVDPSKRL